MEEPQIDRGRKKIERADRVANIGALRVASAGNGVNKIDASARRFLWSGGLQPAELSNRSAG